MNVVSKATLRAFWLRHPRAQSPLEAWFADVGQASWDGPADVKTQFGRTVDFVADNRLIFDVGVHVAYRFKRVLIKFVGTHAEYDRIDPETVR